MFIVTGHSGDYGVGVHPQYFIDDIEDSIADFGASCFRYLSKEEWEDDTGRYEDFTKELFYEWVVDCFKDAGGDKFKIPCYLSFYEPEDVVLDLHTRKWREVDELQNSLE
ncbi:hypothetical protein [Mechercharimyces sp. CAU 1602]|uniref:hypothetical protein n=1 Tax=Mechercharimyces sp. CAU 1602 TaxID=2973933 RepID=UPI0021619D39|nr:hypothetical protein [Mechercharimyces sp. CAU 1602]MCS1350294.1 hypothetical protein [Mechercharimyces sp. CAU 1602]